MKSPATWAVVSATCLFIVSLSCAVAPAEEPQPGSSGGSGASLGGVPLTIDPSEENNTDEPDGSSGGSLHGPTILDCRTDGDGSTTLVFVNGCKEPVVFAGSDLEGGTLEPGEVVACVSPDRDNAQSPVARFFEGCDDAYAWSGDDQQGDDPSPMQACAGEDWDIVFCPEAER